MLETGRGSCAPVGLPVPVGPSGGVTGMPLYGASWPGLVVQLEMCLKRRMLVELRCTCWYYLLEATMTVDLIDNWRWQSKYEKLRSWRSFSIVVDAPKILEICTCITRLGRHRIHNATSSPPENAPPASQPANRFARTFTSWFWNPLRCCICCWSHAPSTTCWRA